MDNIMDKLAESVKKFYPPFSDFLIDGEYTNFPYRERFENAENRHELLFRDIDKVFVHTITKTTTTETYHEFYSIEPPTELHLVKSFNIDMPGLVVTKLCGSEISLGAIKEKMFDLIIKISENYMVISHIVNFDTDGYTRFFYLPSWFSKESLEKRLGVDINF